MTTFCVVSHMTIRVIFFLKRPTLPSETQGTWACDIPIPKEHACLVPSSRVQAGGVTVLHYACLPTVLLLGYPTSTVQGHYLHVQLTCFLFPKSRNHDLNHTTVLSGLGCASPHLLGPPFFKTDSQT